MFASYRFLGLHNELRFLDYLFFLLVAFTLGLNYQDIEAWQKDIIKIRIFFCIPNQEAPWLSNKFPKKPITVKWQ